jgi:hypothetical protein
MEVSAQRVGNVVGDTRFRALAIVAALSVTACSMDNSFRYSCTQGGDIKKETIEGGTWPEAVKDSEIIVDTHGLCADGELSDAETEQLS